MVSFLWGVHWAIVSTISWMIWKKMNSRRKGGRKIPKEITLREGLRIVNLAFVEENNKRTQRSLRFISLQTFKFSFAFLFYVFILF